MRIERLVALWAGLVLTPASAPAFEIGSSDHGTRVHAVVSENHDVVDEELWETHDDRAWTSTAKADATGGATRQRAIAHAHQGAESIRMLPGGCLVIGSYAIVNGVAENVELGPNLPLVESRSVSEAFLEVEFESEHWFLIDGSFAQHTHSAPRATGDADVYLRGAWELRRGSTLVAAASSSFEGPDPDAVYRQTIAWRTPPPSLDHPVTCPPPPSESRAQRPGAYVLRATTTGEASALGPGVAESFGASDLVFVLSRTGTPIEAIVEFLDEAVDRGDLFGLGPAASASARLASFRRRLAAAEALSSDGSIGGACSKLRGAARRSDGEPSPPDTVGGPAVPDLHDMIVDSSTGLGCR